MIRANTRLKARTLSAFLIATLLPLLSVQTVSAQVFAIDGGFALDSQPAEPSVQFNASDGQAQALWAQRGSVIAVGLDGARRSASRSIIMSGVANCDDLPRCTRYTTPRIASVPGGHQWLVAAERLDLEDRGFDHIGGGSFPLILSYPRLEVAAFDAARRVHWRRVLDPAEGNLYIGPQRPSIAATANSVLLAYTDMRPADGLRHRLMVQQLSTRGDLLGEARAISSPAAAWADNGSLAASENEFLLVYETDQDLRAQRIDAFSGTVGRFEVIAVKTAAESTPSGKPVVIYSALHRRYFVSWREDSRIRLLSLSSSGRPLHAPVNLPPPCSGFACLFSSQVAGWPSLSFSPDGDQLNVVFSARPVLDTARVGQVAYSLPLATLASARPSSRWLVAPTDGPADESSHAVSALNPIYAVYRNGNRMYAKFHRE
ncbi:hypothetical protein [Pseudomarimonas arenosa]|uniref:WD40 repeat protein n=1 Tax=Pseudomarimonas arenosa TaxID=2774145 RepID=A0AAW3ZVR1_9GAMM|nr:hypothetical protein [Pseudomarimonas arenosa]MBD8528116.1 hypothetical protein [Pseudomarimonas arenosa]